MWVVVTKPHINLAIRSEELLDDCQLRLSLEQLFVLKTQLKDLRINIPVILRNLLDPILCRNLVTPHL